MMADGGCIGRTYGIDAMSLARHISDMAQHLTQTYGRMLLVSFGGSFPRGRGGGHLRVRGGGKCTHRESIRSFGVWFYELFLA